MHVSAYLNDAPFHRALFFPGMVRSTPFILSVCTLLDEGLPPSWRVSLSLDLPLSLLRSLCFLLVATYYSSLCSPRGFLQLKVQSLPKEHICKKWKIIFNSSFDSKKSFYILNYSMHPRVRLYFGDKSRYTDIFIPRLCRRWGFPVYLCHSFCSPVFFFFLLHTPFASCDYGAKCCFARFSLAPLSTRMFHDATRRERDFLPGFCIPLL